MDTQPTDQLVETARRMFDVASSTGADSGEAQDFALLIRPDGGIHFVMESPFSIEAAALYAGAQSAFRITRSRDGVRVEGRGNSADCVIEQRKTRQMLLPDQRLYYLLDAHNGPVGRCARQSSPLLTAGSAS